MGAKGKKKSKPKGPNRFDDGKDEEVVDVSILKKEKVKVEVPEPADPKSTERKPEDAEKTKVETEVKEEVKVSAQTLTKEDVSKGPVDPTIPTYNLSLGASMTEAVTEVKEDTPLERDEGSNPQPTEQFNLVDKLREATYRRDLITGVTKFGKPVNDGKSSFVEADVFDVGSFGARVELDEFLEDPVLMVFYKELAMFGVAGYVGKVELEDREIELSDFSVVDPDITLVERNKINFSSVKTKDLGKLPERKMPSRVFTDEAGAVKVVDASQRACILAFLSEVELTNLANCISLYDRTYIQQREVVDLIKDVYGVTFSHRERDVRVAAPDGKYENGVDVPAFDKILFRGRAGRLYCYRGLERLISMDVKYARSFIDISHAVASVTYGENANGTGIFHKTKAYTTEWSEFANLVPGDAPNFFHKLTKVQAGGIDTTIEFQTSFKYPIARLFSAFFFLLLVPYQYTLRRGADLAEKIYLMSLSTDKNLRLAMVERLRGAMRPPRLTHPDDIIYALWDALLDPGRWNVYTAGIKAVSKYGMIAADNLDVIEDRVGSLNNIDNDFVDTVWRPFEVLFTQIKNALATWGQTLGGNYGHLPPFAIGSAIRWSFVYSQLRARRIYSLNASAIPPNNDTITSEIIGITGREVVSAFVFGVSDVVERVKDDVRYKIPKIKLAEFSVNSFVDSVRPYWALELLLAVGEWVRSQTGLDDKRRLVVTRYILKRITSIDYGELINVVNLIPPGETLREFFNTVVDPYRGALRLTRFIPITPSVYYFWNCAAASSYMSRQHLSAPRRFIPVRAQDLYSLTGASKVDMDVAFIGTLSQILGGVNSGFVSPVVGARFWMPTRWSAKAAEANDIFLSNKARGTVSLVNVNGRVASELLKMSEPWQSRDGYTFREIYQTTSGLSPITRFEIVGQTPAAVCSLTHTSNTLLNNSVVKKVAYSMILRFAQVNYITPVLHYSFTEDILIRGEG